MHTITKIACRTIGAVGMGFALYDAVNDCKLMSRQQAAYTNQRYLERAYFNSSTIDDVSYNQNNTRKDVFDARTKNPLPTLWGRIKGGVKGFLYGLGCNLPLTAFSSLALLSKGFMAKVGVAGAACCAIYNVLRQGYGVGKQNPMS